MNSIEDQINELIKNSKNNSSLIEGIYLDETLSEFYKFSREIIIPPLSVNEISMQDALELSRIIIPMLPEFVSEHKFSSKRYPPSEQHSLHFTKIIEGKIINFIHILRLNFRQSTRGSRIIQKGDSAHYPSYITDKIYFKSLLVPIYKSSEDLKIIRLNEKETVESDQKRFTSAIFDELSTREISIELSNKIAADIFSIPVKIYPFISYEFFTAALSIPDPFDFKISASAEIYETVFLFLYLTCKNCKGELSNEEILNNIEHIKIKNNETILTTEFLLNLKDYFSSYSLVSDEELLLHGWRKFSIN